MNGYQRIKAALNGEYPDVRPIMLHNFMMAAREAGLKMKKYRNEPDKAANALIDAAEKYDLDGVLVDIDTATLASAVGVTVEYPVDEPALATRASLTSLEQVKDLEPIDISRSQRIQIWLETCRLVKDYFRDEKFIRGNCDQAPFSLACMMRSPEGGMMDIVTDNESVHE